MLREQYGITEMKHWTGRKNLTGEPRNLALVVIVTGFVSHKAARKARTIANKQQAQIIYLNKGLARLEQAVQNSKGAA